MTFVTKIANAFILVEAQQLAESTPIHCSFTGQSRRERFWHTFIADRVRLRTDATTVEYLFPAPKRIENTFAIFESCCEEPEEQRHMEALIYNEELQTFMRAFASLCKDRVFAVTENGMMAVIPSLAKISDEICVIKGVRRPILVRRKRTMGEIQGKERRELVGDCYAHGIMKAEAVGWPTGIAI